ncbi:MAG: hypothetical protein ABSG01_15830 [Anaerolineales bacterium]|jgi:hypothetical protein
MTTVQRAKMILGDKNVFGPKEWLTHFRSVGTNTNFTEARLNEAGEIPWSEDILRTASLGQPHFLFLGLPDLNGTPLNIPGWHALFNNGNNPMFYKETSTLGYDVYRQQKKERFQRFLGTFSQGYAKRTCDLRWYLMPYDVVKGSKGLAYDQQMALLPNEYEVPHAIERIAGFFLYYLLNRKYWKTSAGRTRDLDDKGNRVYLGYNIGFGVLVNSGSDKAEHNMGIAISRKLPVMPSSPVIKVREETPKTEAVDHPAQAETSGTVQQPNLAGEAVRIQPGPLSKEEAFAKRKLTTEAIAKLVEAVKTMDDSTHKLEVSVQGMDDLLAGKAVVQGISRELQGKLTGILEMNENTLNSLKGTKFSIVKAHASLKETDEALAELAVNPDDRLKLERTSAQLLDMETKLENISQKLAIQRKRIEGDLPISPAAPAASVQENAARQPNGIGVRFDISKVNSGVYGKACWKVFWKAVHPAMLAGAQLLEGDTAGTPSRENVYCLAVKWLAGEGRGDEVREALEASEEYKNVAAEPNFIDSAQVNREPLVDAGKVDRSGRLIGGEYRALPALEEARPPVSAAPAAPTAPVAPTAASTTEAAQSDSPGGRFHDLIEAVYEYKNKGFKVASQTSTTATLERRAPVNTVLLVVLILLFWPAALIYWLTRKKYRVMLVEQPGGSVIENENTSSQAVGSQGGRAAGSGNKLGEFERDQTAAKKPKWEIIMIVVGAVLAVLGALFSLILLLSYLSDPTLSKETTTIITTQLVCPLPIVIIGVILLGIGIHKRKHPGKTTQ